MRGFAGRFIALLAAVLVAVSYPMSLPGDSLAKAAARDGSSAEWSGASKSNGPAGGAQAPAGSPGSKGGPIRFAAAGPESPPTPTATPTPTPRPTPTLRPTPTPPSASSSQEKPRARPEAAPARVREAVVELPRRIRIPAIGVDAGFEFVGLAADGAMDVPKDPQQVAWYRLGPRPGEAGNAVVAGHVDWGGKTAIFWKLNELKAGDVVEVVAVDERKYTFAVQSSRWLDAANAPVAEVFRQSDAPEITLITCGGVFDRATRQYLSRLVVKGALR